MTAAVAADVRVARYDTVERVVHWSTAVAMSLLLATGSVLYIGQLSAIFGRRELVRTIHVWSGFALLVPLVVGLLGPWRRALVADMKRLGRWTKADSTWFRAFGRGRRRAVRDRREREWRDDDGPADDIPGVRIPGALPTGKFNGGQKLFGAFVGGAMPVMLATGSIMHWFKPFPDAWRTGATFVHDWIYIGLAIGIVIHIFKALGEPTLLRAMVRGWVPRRWAEVQRPGWLAEVDAAGADRIAEADPPATYDGRPGPDSGDAPWTSASA